MKLNLYQVDAFASALFGGNPAAVCPLPAQGDTAEPAQQISDALLQNIAAENNLSETAFLHGGAGDYHLRWFTPTSEVRLCGHATLAAAWVVFNVLEPNASSVRFSTLGGALTVERDGDQLKMTLPVQTAEPTEPPPALFNALGITSAECLAGEDWLVLLENEAQIVALTPDLTALRSVGRRGVCVSAPGNSADFVSRFFAPQVGIDEDPATGSAQAMLAPIWARRLGKNPLFSKQLSHRGAEFGCRVNSESVTLTGECQLYLTGEIVVPS